MKLDLVHDIQGTYRKVLNAMARPGVIESVEKEAKKVDIDIDCFKSTFLLMLMLLDGEVSFNVISNKSMDISGVVSQITYSKIKSVEEADYIFVINDSTNEKLDEAFSRAKIGTLIDPNKSATIIAEFNEINNEDKLSLTGPGIKDRNNISISGNSSWISARAKKNEEYPLGADVIYLDKNGAVLCIPRTTQISQKED